MGSENCVAPSNNVLDRSAQPLTAYAENSIPADYAGNGIGALGPFANAADALDGLPDDRRVRLVPEGDADRGFILVRDFRRAHGEQQRQKAQAPSTDNEGRIAQPHTPGPWREVETETSVDGDGVSGWGDIADATGRPVAVALGYAHGWGDDTELEANARLIAAAPDLLAVAKMMLATDDEWKALSMDERSRVEAAIAKAEGAQYRCTRCGRNEIDARANGCERGPCPMEFVG